jgi:hypothetical protein
MIHLPLASLGIHISRNKFIQFFQTFLRVAVNQHLVTSGHWSIHAGGLIAEKTAGASLNDDTIMHAIPLSFL